MVERGTGIINKVASERPSKVEPVTFRASDFCNMVYGEDGHYSHRNVMSRRKY